MGIINFFKRIFGTQVDSEEIKALKESLKKCRAASARGMKVAAEQKQAVKDVMDEIAVSSQQLNFSSTTAKVPEAYTAYKENLLSISSDLSAIYHEMNKGLHDYQDKLEHFTITVYGKTMAGKSTLMEVLTHGNGESIGKGSQRTTRDVREYVWKETGLKVVDVPGIAAAKEGGEEDEKIAFEAAKYADLILFLITDDGPQREEAEAFAKVKNLGKPVICVLNVKAAGIRKDLSMKLREYNVTKRMSQKDEFEGIQRQFYEYAGEFGQDWQDVPFLYTDLNTAWLSQQVNDTEEKNKLYQLSQFQNVSTAIIEKINEAGVFYQFKTPVDIVYHSLLNTSNVLLDQYISSAITVMDLDQEIDKLKDVSRKYNDRAMTLMNNCLQQIYKEVLNAADCFAEEHYDDQNAAKAWENTVENLKINGKSITDNIKNLLEDLQDDKERELKHFAMHIPESLQMTLNLTQAEIQGDDPVDTRFLVNLGTAGATGLAALATTGFGLPIALIGAGIGLLLNAFTDSKSDKIRKRQAAMYNGILEWLHGAENEQNTWCNTSQGNPSFMISLSNVLEENYQKIFASFGKTEEGMVGYLNDILSMHKQQLGLWQKINQILGPMNLPIITEALHLLQADEWKDSFANITRIPGKATLLAIKPGLPIDQSVLRNIKQMMQEDFYMYHHDDDFQGEKIVQLIRKLGNISDNQIEAGYIEDLELIWVNNLLAEKVIKQHQQQQFVAEEDRRQMYQIQTLCHLVAQSCNYPVCEFVDND